VTLPVGKSPIALPVVAVPLNVTTVCADTATAANSTVQIGGAIRYVKKEECGQKRKQYTKRGQDVVETV
jgi:hypothetical protein